MVDKAHRTAFVCQQCGHTTPRWRGQCPSCATWESLVEEAVREPKGRSGAARAAGSGPKPRPLAAVPSQDSIRRSTGLDELDPVLGGGLVQGSVTLVGGDPGIGQATPPPPACTPPA